MAMALLQSNNSPPSEPVTVFQSSNTSVTNTEEIKSIHQKSKRNYKKRMTKKDHRSPDPTPINPAETSDHQPPEVTSPSKSNKRSRAPGVRLVGARIYDSEHGKSCHQCRQKTMDFAVACKSQNKTKQCTFNFCYKCLRNRYGEKAEELAKLEDWICPKCRGVCNCSFCMKKRGFHPTGILVHTAKANGFTSVSDMLHISVKSGTDEGASSKKRASKSEKKVLKIKKLKNDDEINEERPEGITQEVGVCSKAIASAQDAEVGSERRDINASGLDRDIDSEYQPESSKITTNKKDSQTTELETLSESDETDNSSYTSEEVEYEEDCADDIPLPQGTELTMVSNVQMPAEDVGNALQLLEFCEAFGKVLDLKKGEPELLLRDLACDDQGSSRKIESVVVQFHIKLLSIIQDTSGKEYSSIKARARNYWVEGLRKCISESEDPSKEQLLGFLDAGPGGYDQLSTSKKLRLLNFLCDESLCTPVLRNWIDEQNAEFVKETKKAKQIVFPGQKEKEKDIKRKIRNEVAAAIIKNNGVPLSISEHENLILRIKAEAAQTLAETLEETDTRTTMKTSSQLNTRADAVRSEPLLVDGSGRVFWKLRGYGGCSDIIFQDIENREIGDCKDKWIGYNQEEKPIIEKYISP